MYLGFVLVPTRRNKECPFFRVQLIKSYGNTTGSSLYLLSLEIPTTTTGALTVQLFMTSIIPRYGIQLAEEMNWCRDVPWEVKNDCAAGRDEDSGVFRFLFNAWFKKWTLIHRALSATGEGSAYFSNKEEEREEKGNDFLLLCKDEIPVVLPVKGASLVSCPKTFLKSFVND